MSEVLVSHLSLSPSFDRARRISGFLSVILAVGFWVTVAGAVVITCVFFGQLIFNPDPGLLAGGKLQLNNGIVYLDKLSPNERLYGLAALAILSVPSLVILHHARLIFRHFKRGEVFAVAPIDHIRQTGLWLMISLGTNLIAQLLLDLAARSQTHVVDFDADPLWLVFGLGLYVAAYVMAEARRIADDNAEII